MKRLVYSSNNEAHNYTLNIVVNVYEDEYSVAASELSDFGNLQLNYLKYNNISDGFQFDPEQFKRLDAVIGKIVSLVNKMGFEITRQGQSNLSYSYYITFPADASMLDIITIQIEIRDHSRKGHKTKGWLSSDRYLYTYNVGDRKCFDTSTTISEVWRVLKNVKKGDFEDLESRPAPKKKK